MPHYSFKVEWSDEDEGYIVTSPEFPGMSALGSSVDEAMREGQIALRAMIKSYEVTGEALPAEKKVHHHSGQFRVRISKTLHQQAAEMAEREGVSLNHFVAEAIARAVGSKVSASSTTQAAIITCQIHRGHLKWASTLMEHLTQVQAGQLRFEQVLQKSAQESGTAPIYVH